MIGISGSYVEVADGDSTQITVPRRDTDLPLYFSVRCPDGYARCTVVLDNPPVEANRRAVPDVRADAGTGAASTTRRKWRSRSPSVMSHVSMS